MTSSVRPRLRVALATAPAMLSDILRSLLEADAEVTILLTESVERFDLALTTAGAPDVLADVVIDLDASSVQGGGRIRSDGSVAGRSLSNLGEVILFIQHAATRS